jgi:Probable molybdopterin binding domain
MSNSLRAQFLMRRSRQSFSRLVRSSQQIACGSPEELAGQTMGTRRKQAAGLIIGNEILNGKTLDTNTQVLAQFLYARGISLARCETLPDDIPTVRKAVSRLGATHDYVFTSGGIGPTLDDITYEVCARRKRCCSSFSRKTASPGVGRIGDADFNNLSNLNLFDSGRLT